jgi:hypothetical protein
MMMVDLKCQIGEDVVMPEIPADPPTPTSEAVVTAAEVFDQTSTGLTGRGWIAKEVTRLRELLVRHNGASVLPAELIALAQSMHTDNKGDAWPRWLVLGIGIRLTRQRVERLLKKQARADKTSTKREEG